MLNRISRALAAALLLAAGPAMAAPPTPVSPPYPPSATIVTARAPTPSDDATAGYAVGSLWLYGGDLYQAQRVTAGKAMWSKVPPAALPCDVAACAIAYSTKRLRSAYAGNALTLTRTSDSTTKAIGFLSNGDIDGATADAFCTGLAATACLVTTWNDQSGNVYDATAATATAPIWQTVKVAGSRAVSFASVANTTGNIAQVARFMTVPTGFSWTPNASTWFFAGQQNNTESNRVMAETTAHVGFMTDYVQNAADGLNLQGSGSKCNMPVDVEPAVIGVDWNGGTVTCSSNNMGSTNGTGGGSTPATGANLGTNATDRPADMDEFAIVAFNSALSATNFASVRLSLHALFAIAPQSQDVLLWDGDSTSSGAGSVLDNTFTRLAIPLLSRPMRVYNSAVFGTSLATRLARLQYSLGSVYSATAKNVVVGLLAGPNDIRGGASAAAIYTNLQSYVTAAKAYGSNVRVLVSSAMLQCDIYGSSTHLPIIQALNGMIQANWNVPQSQGGLGADGLIDFQQDPTIGPASYSSSAFCSTTIATSDGQHPLDITMPYFSQPMAAAVNGALR